ncbi:MAG: hypothetical protein ABIM82_07880, partial [candidate division WOR-3 bacterium]
IGKTTLKNYWLKIFEGKEDFFIFEGEPLFEIYGSPIGTIQKAITKFIEKEKNILFNNFFNSYCKFKLQT